MVLVYTIVRVGTCGYLPQETDADDLSHFHTLSVNRLQGVDEARLGVPNLKDIILPI